ncbi:MAG: serine/threonine-protein kinase [Polyangiaceae bacterium]
MTDDLPIESRFTLEERIGRGGSGDVHRAVDRETGERVAVKRLFAIHDDPALIDRFRREARLLAQIDHPNVVRYVAHGTDQAGRPCIVVEWLDGEDLSRRQKRERLTIREALDVARQAALGLSSLHQAGIIHRDVKPANLFLLPREGGGFAVKLIDLGIARAVGEVTLTELGNMVGTPYYMAPEQARGEERVTSRADQFALGAVLFEMLTGRRAFGGEDVFAVLAKIVLAEPPRLADVMPGAPPLLEALLRRAMSKEPSDRFPSAVELAEAIAMIEPWEPGGAAAAVEVLGDDPTTRVAAMGSALERRVVTAMFAGFAPGTQEGDLRAFAMLAAEHGGAAHPTLGRRRVAVFGGALTTGEEAIRAARAALEAVDRIPGVRIAIATGRALAGAAGLSGDIIDRGVRVVEREGRSLSTGCGRSGSIRGRRTSSASISSSGERRTRACFRGCGRRRRLRGRCWESRRRAWGAIGS